MGIISETLFIGYDSSNGIDPSCLSVMKRTGNPKKPYKYLNNFFGGEADTLYTKLVGSLNIEEENNNE